MPLYEYQCVACAHRFEQIQKFSDPPVQTCPACGGDVRKLLSSSAIQFKGSGWYITDYARKDHGKPAPASAGSETKADSGSTPAEPASSSAGSADTKAPSTSS